MVELDTLTIASALVPNRLLFTALDEIYEGRYWLVMREKHTVSTISTEFAPTGRARAYPQTAKPLVGYMNDSFIFLISPAFS